jgi:hypothetical protein
VRPHQLDILLQEPPGSQIPGAPRCGGKGQTGRVGHSRDGLSSPEWGTHAGCGSQLAGLTVGSQESSGYRTPETVSDDGEMNTSRHWAYPSAKRARDDLGNLSVESCSVGKTRKISITSPQEVKLSLDESEGLSAKSLKNEIKSSDMDSSMSAPSNAGEIAIALDGHESASLKPSDTGKIVCGV